MAGKNTMEVTEATFDAEVVQSTQPVVVDFWAEWCGPCKRIAPMLEELATEFSGRAKIAKVDIDSNQMLAERFGIRSIPTLLFFNDGRVVDTVIGVDAKQNIKKRIEDQIKQ
ncbi:MAG: thioredoxin [bacterium]